MLFYKICKTFLGLFGLLFYEKNRILEQVFISLGLNIMNTKHWLATAGIVGGLAILPAVVVAFNDEQDLGPAGQDKVAETAFKVISQGSGNADDESVPPTQTLNNLSQTSTERTTEFNDKNTPANDLVMGSTSNNTASQTATRTAVNTPATQKAPNAMCTPNAEALKVGIKHYPFKEQTNLVTIGNGYKLHPDAAEALKKMLAAARSEGVTLTVGSAFRSVSYQQGIIERKKKAGQSHKQIYHMSAPAGHSEHHTGFAVDFSPINSGFAKTKGYQWLLKNADKYGFKQTFTAAYAAKSGVAEESWHWKFVDSAAAKQALAAQDCY